MQMTKDTNKSIFDMTNKIFQNRKIDTIDKNKLNLGIILLLYFFIIIFFFRTILTTWPTVVYTIIIFVLFGVVLARIYNFYEHFAAEIIILHKLSNNISAVVADLKDLSANSRDTLSPNDVFVKVQKTLTRYHKISNNSFMAKIACDTLLRYMSRTRLEINELISESLQSNLKDNQSILNIGSSVSIAIGLLGTFAGMMHSIGGEITILKLISGLHEAIGSSIIGVLTAIFIIAISKHYYKSEMELQNQISQFLMWGFFPEFQIDLSVKIDARAADIIAKKIGETLSQKLHEIIDNLHDAIRDWNQMITKINQTFIEMSGSLKGLSSELSQNKQIVSTANDKLIEVLDRLSTTSKILKSDLQKWISDNPVLAIRNSIDLIKEGADKLSDTVGNMDMTIKQYMDNFIIKAADYWKPIEESIDVHSTSLKDFVDKVAGFGKNFDTMINKIDGLKNQLELITEQLDEDESTKKRIARIKERVEKETKKFYEEELKVGHLQIRDGRIVRQK